MTNQSTVAAGMTDNRCGVRLETPGTTTNGSAVLASLVDRVADWDIVSCDQAQSLAVKVVPSLHPVLIVQYRAPLASTWQLGCSGPRKLDYIQVASIHQSGIVTIRPDGPIGAIFVHLKPESAARLLGNQMRTFLDAQVSLGDVFGTGPVSLLQEQLCEARTSAERFAYIAQFLVANLQQRELEPSMCRAAAFLRQNPCLRVRELAARLDISERHLLRRFRMMFGTTLKEFARIARVEKILLARARGASWTETAHKCGFADQSHMIRDFRAIVGVSPTQLEHPTATKLGDEGYTIVCGHFVRIEVPGLGSGKERQDNWSYQSALHCKPPDVALGSGAASSRRLPSRRVYLR
jgi:AraC-like DNA-binding protein